MRDALSTATAPLRLCCALPASRSSAQVRVRRAGLRRRQTQHRSPKCSSSPALTTRQPPTPKCTAAQQVRSPFPSHTRAPSTEHSTHTRAQNGGRVGLVRAREQTTPLFPATRAGSHARLHTAAKKTRLHRARLLTPRTTTTAPTTTPTNNTLPLPQACSPLPTV